MRRLSRMQSVYELENKAGTIELQSAVITTFIALLSHVPADHSMTQVSSLSSARPVAFAAERDSRIDPRGVTTQVYRYL